MAEETKVKEADKKAVKTGAALLEYLEKDYTPEETQTLARVFFTLKPQATAAEILAHLEERQVYFATLDKIARWLHGPAYVRPAAVPKDTAATVADLTARCRMWEERCHNAEGKVLALQAQLHMVDDQRLKLAGQASFAYNPPPITEKRPTLEMKPV